MMSTVLASTLSQGSGITSLTKNKSGTADLLRNGSMYVGFPNLATMRLPDPTTVSVGVMVTG